MLSAKEQQLLTEQPYIPYPQQLRGIKAEERNALLLEIAMEAKAKLRLRAQKQNQRAAERREKRAGKWAIKEVGECRPTNDCIHSVIACAIPMPDCMINCGLTDAELSC